MSWAKQGFTVHRNAGRECRVVPLPLHLSNMRPDCSRYACRSIKLPVSFGRSSTLYIVCTARRYPLIFGELTFILVLAHGSSVTDSYYSSSINGKPIPPSSPLAAWISAPLASIQRRTWNRPPYRSEARCCQGADRRPARSVALSGTWAARAVA